MEYRLKNNKEQLMLAGDPMQLGPIITSDLCKKFNVDQSHIQRILKTIPAYRIVEDTHDCVAKSQLSDMVNLLVNHSRSHPDILKLP
mmetsp:Transcript_24937/g.68752  ORF Transcript_24937/g.68752 Transcript_24937/m.68752 type:complete len:87 (+) Transcript_24937:932-1192(+)